MAGDQNHHRHKDNTILTHTESSSIPVELNNFLARFDPTATQPPQGHPPGVLVLHPHEVRGALRNKTQDYWTKQCAKTDPETLHRRVDSSDHQPIQHLPGAVCLKTATVMPDADSRQDLPLASGPNTGSNKVF